MENEIVKIGDMTLLVADGETITFDSCMYDVLEKVNGYVFINRRSKTPNPVISIEGKAVYLRRYIFGEVPVNYCVVSLDGDYKNMRKSNLRAVPRALLWAYTFSEGDLSKCIRKYSRGGFCVVVGDVNYGKYLLKEVALQCRNEVIRDLKLGELKDDVYYSTKYRKIEIMTLIENEEFELLNRRYKNEVI